MDSDSEWDLLECLPGDPWSIAIDHIQFDGKKNITTHELTHQIIEKPQRFNCHFPFFNLPRELRDKVYRYLINPNYLTHPPLRRTYRHHDKFFDPSILRGSHRLRDEFPGIFFENTTAQVRISNSSSYHYSLPVDVPAAFKPFINSVSIAYFQTDMIGHKIQDWPDPLSDAA
ncbi:hypothetical protein AOQ84DRAFT_379845 [Glonium stellatum]|uniref:F-box domain-containing protein n=1 Tax=Glonium stellatum TaxID=574774 RepID=A0A8E2EV19_9PEZI|nr:hypothetical protein AOQ84DRAFT_379845 [Glonium stellatum]